MTVFLEKTMLWIYEYFRDEYSVPCCSPDTIDRTPQKHLHYNLEILYMLRGNSIIGLYDGRIRLKEVPIDEGEFLIIGSGVIHDHTMKNGEMYLGWIPLQRMPM